MSAWTLRPAGRPQGIATQAERVLRLCVDLGAKAWTVADLARRYDVTERTIRRDLLVVSRVYEVARDTSPKGVTMRLAGGAE